MEKSQVRIQSVGPDCRVNFTLYNSVCPRQQGIGFIERRTPGAFLKRHIFREKIAQSRKINGCGKAFISPESIHGFGNFFNFAVNRRQFIRRGLLRWQL